MARLLFLIGFMLLLSLPAVQMVTGFPRLPTVDENRNLAPTPSLKSWVAVDQYTSDAVKWFNDHFGFRDFLIRAKTQIDYTVFGISTRVHVGKEGWFFYRSVMDVQKPQIELLLRTEADAVIEGTRQLVNALAARNIQLIMTIAPMKDVYYSEYLPKTAKKLPAPGQVNLLQDRLKVMKEIIFIDSFSILRDVASSRNVFHKTDFHWNDPAAFDVSRALVNEIGMLEGKANPVWTHKLEIEKKSFSGGEASFMPIFFPPKESGLFIKQNWIQPPFKYTEKIPPFDSIYEAKQPTGDQLLPIVVLGDSFFDGMIRSGTQKYFKKIYQANWNRTNLKDLIGKLPADTRYLFLEFIEVESRAYLALAAEKSRQ